jgi:FAD/FMN-containing dehydrogenase
LTVVLSDGRLLSLQRGRTAANGSLFALRQTNGSVVEITLPRVPMPETKHADDGIAAMRDLKGSLDPGRLFNPGVLFPDSLA